MISRIIFKKFPKLRVVFLVLLVLLFLILAGWLGCRVLRDKSRNESTEQTVETEETKDGEAVALPPASLPDQNEIKEEEKTPPSFRLDVPFLVQAPLAVWDALHEDACEEASLIMVERYLNKRGEITAEEGDREIGRLIEYQSARGYGLSITLSELNRIAGDYYGLKNGRILSEISAEAIKLKISRGQIIIVPAAGKILPNPNFRNGGPNYHMLVITGYDEDEFITNDPGTRNGRDFHYKYDDLINAIRDWNTENILSGERVYLVFE